MKQLNKGWVLCLSMIGITLLYSCTKEKSVNENQVFSNPGIFICNQGQFQSGTGTIDYYCLGDHQLQQNIFEAKNGIPLGNIAQSMLQVGDTIYIVVNNANKVVVVNARDFSLIGTINGLSYPCNMVCVSGKKAYVSCWDNTLAIINLTDLTVSGHISVGTGPQKMLKAGNNVLVLNQGGLSIDSTISIVNASTDQVIQTLQVYPKPTGIVQEKGSGAIWVMCSGHGWNGWPDPSDSKGHLLKLQSVSKFSIAADLSFPDQTRHPENLIENVWTNELIYLYNNGLYKQKESSAKLDTLHFINRSVYYYSLAYFDRGSAASSCVVASDPLDNVQNGWVYFFRASDGIPVDSVRSGIIPTDYIFQK